MAKLINIENPVIYVVAPKSYIVEVGGNCLQVNSSQPITFAKALWRLDDKQSEKEDKQ